MEYEINHQELADTIVATAKKASITAGLYIFLAFIFAFFFYMVGISVIIGSSNDVMNLSDPEIIEQLMLNNTVEFLILNTIATILLHYLFGGIYGMISKLYSQPYTTLTDALKTIFSIRGLKALNVIIIIQLVTTGISFIMQLYNFALVGLGLSLLIQLLTYFALPAIYIQNLSVIKSIKQSVQIVNTKPGFFMFFIAATYFVSLSGILFFGIGLILTLPLNYIVAYHLYTHISKQITN